MWCRSEGAGYHIYHFILNGLEAIDMCLHPFAPLTIPELATVSEDWEANGVHNKAPVGHAKSADCVP